MIYDDRGKMVKGERTMKKLRCSCLAVCMAVLLVACGDKKNVAKKTTEPKTLKKITFCLDWTPNTHHSGIYVAQAKGFYEEAGFEVEIVQPPENGAEIMCSTGQAQFAIASQDTLVNDWTQDSPLGITAVAAITQHNTLGILSRKGDGIDTPKGLTNKNYSTWGLPIECTVLENIVERDGGDFSKVNLLANDITNEVEALAEKKTDAIWAFEGLGKTKADVNNIAVDFFRFRDYDSVLDYYSLVIVANDKFLREMPDIAKEFMKATSKGYEYAANYPEDAAKILIEGDTTGTLKGEEAFVNQSQKFESAHYINDAKNWGFIDEMRWNKFYTWLYNNGLCEKDLTNFGFTNEYLQD